MTAFTAGQEVMLLPSMNQRRAQPEVVTIKRVARKYVYVEQYAREVAFDIEDGMQKTDHPGVAQRIKTFEQYHEDIRRQAARERLDELGIRQMGYGDYRQSTDTLEAIIAVIEEKEREIDD